jgi:hypothetical protein
MPSADSKAAGAAEYADGHAIAAVIAAAHENGLMRADMTVA